MENERPYWQLHFLVAGVYCFLSIAGSAHSACISFSIAASVPCRRIVLPSVFLAGPTSAIMTR